MVFVPRAFPRRHRLVASGGEGTRSPRIAFVPDGSHFPAPRKTARGRGSFHVYRWRDGGHANLLLGVDAERTKIDLTSTVLHTRTMTPIDE